MRTSSDRLRVVTVLAVASFLAGCGDDDGAPVGLDSGTPRDAGAGMDAPPGEVDAGGGGDVDAGGGGDVDAGPPVELDAGPTGTCPAPCGAGFTCSPGGYCASSTGVPAFGKIYIIEMENHGLASITGSTSAPYLNGLMTMHATATNYLGVARPSLPNYIALVSGSTGGIGCNCRPIGSACTGFTCNLILNNCRCNQARTHLGNQLDAAGWEWREYAEGMGTPCNGTDNPAAHYATKHVPFLYFDDVFMDTPRCMARVRDYGDFAADLAAGTYRFLYVTPDLCNDMHDDCGGAGGAIGQGDTWLSTNVPPILATPGFAPGGTDVLFITFDEDDGSGSSDPIPFVAISPLARGGAVTTAAHDHYSFLATLEDAIGAPRLDMATGRTPINDIWR